jgi:hypothetical protein
VDARAKQPHDLGELETAAFAAEHSQLRQTDTYKPIAFAVLAASCLEEPLESLDRSRPGETAEARSDFPDCPNLVVHRGGYYATCDSHIGGSITPTS